MPSLNGGPCRHLSRAKGPIGDDSHLLGKEWVASKMWTGSERFLSRRDGMKVARHEMPGTCPKGDPSRRDGVIVILGYPPLSDPRTPLKPPIIPSRWDGGISYTQPRHFMPGYLHSVPAATLRVAMRAGPSGQNLPSPCLQNLRQITRDSRGQLVRRSPCSMLPDPRRRQRKRGALHT